VIDTWTRSGSSPPMTLGLQPGVPAYGDSGGRLGMRWGRHLGEALGLPQQPSPRGSNSPPTWHVASGNSVTQ
jgi:hypothetical protein